MRYALLLIVTAAAVRAEDLSARDAVLRALSGSPSIAAEAAGVKGAGAKVDEARSTLLPQVNYIEQWQRSNNPVFVFGSLLDQRQFAARNFDLEFLNHPPFLDNFQSLVTAEQIVYDRGRRARIKAAELGQSASTEEARGTQMSVIGEVLRAYYSALLAKSNVEAADDAVKSAEADLKRAQDRRDAGFTTDADVLSIQVHVSAMHERQIARRGELDLAMASLNTAMGVPMDTQFALVTGLSAVTVDAKAGAEIEKEAAENRPETRAARIATEIRDQQSREARAAFVPQVFVRGGFEADRQKFGADGGANWVVSAGLRWNLFNGFADKARVAQASHEAERSRAMARETSNAAQLNARAAWLALRTATERIEVAKAATAMAEESLRIIRNRYDAGLTEVTELLRAENALLDARTRSLEAIASQRIAAVAVESARGTLSKDSVVVTQ